MGVGGDGVQGDATTKCLHDTVGRGIGNGELVEGWGCGKVGGRGRPTGLAE